MLPILDKLRNMFSRQKPEEEVEWELDNFYSDMLSLKGVGPFPADLTFFRPLRLGIDGATIRDPYQQHVWVYAAVTAIARNLSQTPWVIKRANDPENTPIEQGKLFNLFRRPNPNLSRFQLWEATVIFLLLNGECLWIMQGAGLEAGLRSGEVPVELWPMNGKLFTPIFAKDSDQIVVAWKFRDRNNKEHIIPASETIQFKLFNNQDQIRGLSPLEALRKTVSTDWLSGVFSEALLRNGADPGGVLLNKGRPLTDEQVTSTRRQWEDRHKGALKQGRIAILNNMEYKQIQTSKKDMQFLQERTWNRDAILAVYKVPKSELSLFEDVNFATAKEASRSFWTKTIIPLMRMIEDKVDVDLLSKVEDDRFEGFFDLSEVEALQEGFDDLLESGLKLAKLGYPPNMINERLELGMPKIDWGDDAFVSGTLITAREVVGGSGHLDEEDGKKKKKKPKKMLSEGLEDEFDDDPEEKQQTRKQRRFWLKWKREILDPHEKPFKSRMRRYFFQLRNDQLRRFDEAAEESEEEEERSIDFVTAALGVEDVESILFEKQKWNDNLKRLTRPLFTKQTEDVLEFMSVELDGVFRTDLIDPEILNAIEQKEILITQVNDRMRERIRSQLLKGITAAESTGVLRDRLVREFQFASNRATTIARTEVGQMTSAARQATMKNEGIEKKEWVTAADELVRDTHNLDGRVDPIPIDQRFPNTGLLHPLEMGGPPGEIINCRCVAVPVVERPS